MKLLSKPSSTKKRTALIIWNSHYRLKEDTSLNPDEVQDEILLHLNQHLKIWLATILYKRDKFYRFLCGTSDYKIELKKFDKSFLQELAVKRLKREQVFKSIPFAISINLPMPSVNELIKMKQMDKILSFVEEVDMLPFGCGAIRLKYDEIAEQFIKFGSENSKRQKTPCFTLM